MKNDPAQLPEASRELDARLHEMFRGPVLRVRSGMFSDGHPVPAYTASIDAAVSLIRNQLPGWVWGVHENHASDYAWIMPNLKHPEYQAAFLAKFCADGAPYGGGPIEIKSNVAGHAPIALLAALVSAVQGLRTDALPREDAYDLRRVADGAGLYPEMKTEQMNRQPVQEPLLDMEISP